MAVLDRLISPWLKGGARFLRAGPGRKPTWWAESPD
jgi:hypothetical protein